MSGNALYDALGPRGRRRMRIASTLAAVAFAGLVAVALTRLADKGQLDADRWRFLVDGAILRFLWNGLLNTLEVAAVAGLLAFAVGGLMALGRLARSWPIRFLTSFYVQFWRAVPLLLLIYFISLGFPVLGLRLPAFWFLVIGLTLYNSAVLAEIFRAGVLSLDRGQSEAAYAVGLTHWQTMRLVVVPQAVRRMVPALVSQFVTLLKDSSLGFVIPYQELLRRGQLVGQFANSVLQAYVVVAVIFVVVNASLSKLARWLESRQRRRYGAVAAREVEPILTQAELSQAGAIGPIIGGRREE